MLLITYNIQLYSTTTTTEFAKRWAVESTEGGEFTASIADIWAQSRYCWFTGDCRDTEKSKIGESMLIRKLLLRLRLANCQLKSHVEKINKNRMHHCKWKVMSSNRSLSTVLLTHFSHCGEHQLINLMKFLYDYFSSRSIGISRKFRNNNKIHFLLRGMIDLFNIAAIC